MKLHVEEPFIRENMKEGKTGLELESHRVTETGNLAHSPHPFPGSDYIDRDFSEEQMEINTPPAKSPGKALGFLEKQLALIHRKLDKRGELLWPFSNPPIIIDEDDIPVARYEGEKLPSYHYRLYLAARYGKYKMTYSGIHFNYSFSEELLAANCKLDGYEDYDGYKAQFYLNLAEKALAYSWAVVALLAASPVVDNSFYEQGKSGQSIFTGFSSLRNSEFGYWNPFLPVLSYENIGDYVESIENYLEQGLLIEARELYYPVRIKPSGMYTLNALRSGKISHIELRQVDLDPFVRSGLDPRDAEFLKLFLIWLASIEMPPLTAYDQLQALQNHKAAAAYDWDLARIALPERSADTLKNHLSEMLEKMRQLYLDDDEALRILAYQQQKVDDESKRYANMVREAYGEDYIRQGLERAKKIREEFDV